MPVRAKRLRVKLHDSLLESRQRAQSRRGDRDRLEQFAHAARAFGDQPRQGDIDLGGFARRRIGLERGGALHDAEPQKQIALADRPVNARAHAFGALGEGFEVDMRGEVGVARRAKRIGEGMSGDRLQRVAQAEFGMAVVDDQGCSLVAQTPSKLERKTVGAPFEDRAFGRFAQSARQRRLEMRQRLGRGDNAQVAVGRDVDHALVPAARLLDGLVHRQRVDEFIGDDDARARRHFVEPRVPQHRHMRGFRACAAAPAAAPD